MLTPTPAPANPSLAPRFGLVHRLMATAGAIAIPMAGACAGRRQIGIDPNVESPVRLQEFFLERILQGQGSFFELCGLLIPPAHIEKANATKMVRSRHLDVFLDCIDRLIELCAPGFIPAVYDLLEFVLSGGKVWHGIVLPSLSSAPRRGLHTEHSRACPRCAESDMG